jgi:hypothetical protein
MSDDLQHGINQACVYFYSKYEDPRQVADEMAAKNTEVKLKIRDMNVLLMLGIGYLIGRGYLYYRGDQHYSINLIGFDYYKSLIENGDIVP